jgi:hypothetical protein
MSLSDLIWTLVSFILTLMVLSYILGDNPFFRFASALFVGVAAGYVVVISFYQVVLPKLLLPLIQPQVSLAEKALLLIPLALAILLLLKLSPRTSRVGNSTMAYLVGVGAAVAIGGAVLGTIFPQVGATINLFDMRAASAAGNSLGGQLLEGVYVLAGVSATLLYFYFGVRAKPDVEPQRHPAIEAMAQAGQIFIAITLGSLFAGVYAAAIASLVERAQFIWHSISLLFL